MSETPTTDRATDSATSTADGAADDMPLLRVEHIAKRFGTIVALDDISFDVDRGEVVALLGDNGAGKSTLVKILSGTEYPDSGRILFEGRPITIDSPATAKSHGIETVYQDLSLCMNMDVVANFFMGREICTRFLGLNVVRDREMEREATEALGNIGVRLPDVRAKVEKLSGGQRQGVELGRFVYWGGKLVLLDEPFAALGVDQTRRGLDLVERVKREGVAVVVITHNMLHAFQVADRIVVLRHGRVTGVRRREETSSQEIVNMITGEELVDAETRPPDSAPGDRGS
ncbi:MAG: ATP-binding cassette domain-containing protein [Azospirillaceae bacterium]